MQERLTGLVGIVAIAALAWGVGPRELKGRVQWRPVLVGFGLLVTLTLVLLKTPARLFFGWANAGVEGLLGFSREGARFLFGPLADSKALGFVFAFQILPTIIFFAALMSILYYVGVMPWIVRNLGRFLSRVMGTSGAESFSTVADIFVGQTEAPLVIKPYLPTLTKSELLACMVAGFATTAGGVLAAYVGMLSPFIPDIAGHLIACSVLAAPASLVIAKLMWPETEPSKTAGVVELEVPEAGSNLLDAVAAGTTDGVKLAVNVGAMLVTFIALTAMANALLGWAGNLAGIHLTLERILGWVFSPLAWLMGVPSQDVTKVASLLGQKTVLNEFVAYARMGQELSTNGDWLTERGRLIASYALCGFANIASIGIQIGGYTALAPERRSDLAKLGLRAMIGGLLTTCLVATVVGVVV